MMKILHFYKTYYPESVGGVEQVIHELAEGGRAHGVVSRVLTLGKSPRWHVAMVDHHEVGYIPRSFEVASTGFALSAVSRFRQWAAEADIIHYHFPWPFMDLVHFLSGVKKPTVVTYHSDIIRQRRLLWFYQPLMVAFMRSVSSIVATSPNYFMTSRILQRFRKKVSVIPLGVNRSGYPVPDAARLQEWRAQLGERFFIFVGVLRYYKGLDILLEALALREFPTVIVGAGPVEAELKAQASRLGLTQLKFLGRVSEEDKMALIQLSTAMVFPSHLRSEAFGISLVEGAMCGKPLISCEIGTGTSYVNEHGVTGLVVTPGDEHALSAAMSALWDDPALAEQMGERAGQRYAQHFTADAMVARYDALYQRLLDQSGH